MLRRRLLVAWSLVAGAALPFAVPGGRSPVTGRRSLLALRRFPFRCRSSSPAAYHEVMATYEYRCPTCDSRFELRRPMSDSSEAATCPDGHPGAVRLLSVFASVSGAGGSAPAFDGGGGPCGPACACHPG